MSWKENKKERCWEWKKEGVDLTDRGAKTEKVSITGEGVAETDDGNV